MTNTDFENLRAHAQRGDYTNAHLARRVIELEKALDKAADDIAFLRNFFEIQSKQYADKQIAAEEDAARLRAALERVEWIEFGGGDICPWCYAPDYKGHRPNCARQAALAQTQEVKA